MPNKTIPADRIIGVQLIAAKRLDKLNFSRNKIGEFKPGEIIGRVTTYVQLGTPNVYWVFGKSPVNYLVQHAEGNFKREGELKAALDKWEREQKAEQEKELIEQQGKIPYYIKKYGVWVLAAIAGTILLKTYITKRG